MTMTEPDHRVMMRAAVAEAELALREGEVPVGAVVARGREIVARAHNRVEALKDTAAHAEMLVIRLAQTALCQKYLSDCTLYVTLEPCAMCAGAILHARLAAVYYGAPDPRAGAMGSVYLLTGDPAMPDRVPVFGGLLAEACGAQLQNFFHMVREKMP